MSGPSGSAPPQDVPPGPPPSPPPGYAPYPPYPYYPWHPPPPARDNAALILVIVLVLLLVVPLVLGAMLYVMVSGLIRGPALAPPPIFLFGPVDQTNGNATIRIGPNAEPMHPGDLRISLRANHSASAIVDLPPPDGSVSLTAGAYTLRVFWLDDNGDRLVGWSDAFWITGNLSPLPAATLFELTVVLMGRGGEASISWTTP